MTKTDQENSTMLREYPNHSFCRDSKRLFRTVYRKYIPIKKDDSGRFKIKKNGDPHMFTETELMKMTDYAVLRKGKV